MTKLSTEEATRLLMEEKTERENNAAKAFDAAIQQIQKEYRCTLEIVHTVSSRTGAGFQFVWHAAV